MSKLIKKLSFKDTARTAVLSGVNKLYQAVSSTLGAAGKTVIIEDEYGKPQITKDGVTVAKSVLLKDSLENMGAQLVIEVASKTNDEAGDGTTTSTVLANAVMQLGSNELDSNKQTVTKDFFEGMNFAKNTIIENIKDLSVKIPMGTEEGEEMLRNVASISANNDEFIGRVVSDAFLDAGKDGIVVAENSLTSKTYLETVRGSQFERGYSNPVFVTDQENQKCSLKNPHVFITEEPISNTRLLIPILEYCIQNSRSLLIIGEVEGECLQTLAQNKIKGVLKVCVVKPPMFGIKRKEMMQDLAIITGSTLFSNETGDSLDLITFDALGECVSADIDSKTTTLFTGEIADEVNDRSEELKKRLSKEESEYSRDYLQRRIAMLTGGISVVYVGGNTDIEQKELRDRVDDAICATRSSIEEGVVIGGGALLYQIHLKLKTVPSGTESFIAGYTVVINSILSPIFTIIENSGIDSFSVIDSFPKNLGLDIGYNVLTGKYVDMKEAGIIDPAKVTRCAVENAISVAITLLNTNCVITNIREYEGK